MKRAPEAFVQPSPLRVTDRWSKYCSHMFFAIVAIQLFSARVVISPLLNPWLDAWFFECFFYLRYQVAALSGLNSLPPRSKLEIAFSQMSCIPRITEPHLPTALAVLPGSERRPAPIYYYAEVLHRACCGEAMYLYLRAEQERRQVHRHQHTRRITHHFVYCLYLFIH